MKKTLFILIAILCCTAFSKAQELNDIRRLNDYKYFIVPMQFKTADEPNEYLLSSLTKHLLQKEGFPTIVDTEKFPKDLALNNCLGLRVELIDDNSNFSFTTDVGLKFVDCNNLIVYETTIASSRKKTNKEAYQEALRTAFSSFTGYVYNYNPDKKVSEVIVEDGEVPIISEDIPIVLSDFIGHNLMFDEKKYMLSKIDAGFLVSESETGNRKAFISQNSSGDYLYNSEKINGSLKIVDNTTLEVEYFDMNENEMKKMVYKVNQ